MTIREGLTFGDMNKFGVDEKTGELYWEGKKVVTQHVVTLQFYERFLATLASLAAVAAAAHPFGVTFGWW